MVQKSDRPKLPCPACGSARIGNQKVRCKLCNRFNQRAKQVTVRIFRAKHPALHEQILMQAEAEVYKSVLEKYTEEMLEGL